MRGSWNLHGLRSRLLVFRVQGFGTEGSGLQGLRFWVETLWGLQGGGTLNPKPKTLNPKPRFLGQVWGLGSLGFTGFGL